MAHTEKMTIAAIPPFRFDLSAEIFADGDKQIRRYENGRFWQLIRINDKLVLAIVESVGTVNEPKLSVVLRSNSKITEHDKEKAAEIIKKYGATLTVDGEVYYAYPTPQQIAAAPLEELRGCGLSQRKAEYIKEI